MGRAKMAMKLITKEKVRNSTFVKRNKGLFKKAKELSILCNVPICVIIYNPYKEAGKQQPFEPEVYAFKGDDGNNNNNNNNNNDVVATSSSPNEMNKFAREMIDRYLRVPIEERKKRTVTLHDMLGKKEKIRVDDDQDQLLCATLGHNNNDDINNNDNKYNKNNPSYCVDSSFLDGFDHDKLVEFLGHLDQKIEYVKQRIDMIKGTNNNYNQNQAAAAEADLLPYFDQQPTPMSSFMNPGENNNNYVHNHHHHHQMGLPEFEGINQIPMFNYPMINNNNECCPNQEWYHQIMPFNQHNNNNIVFSDQVGAATKLDDEDHHGGSSISSNNNLVMYNMMMGNVGPFYYDQRTGFVDNVGASSSYGGGLPMSMPVQMPRMQPNNVPLQWQRPYHPIFY